MTTSSSFVSVVVALVSLVTAPAAFAGQPPARTSAIVIRDAWVRTPAPSVPMTAGYLTAENPSSQDVVIVAVSSVAGTIEMHEMRDENGRASMRMVETIVIPARGTVKLAPGGLHLMIMNMPKPLVAGDEVRLTLTMRDGTVAVARAVVKAAP